MDTPPPLLIQNFYCLAETAVFLSKNLKFLEEPAFSPVSLSSVPNPSFLNHNCRVPLFVSCLCFPVVVEMENEILNLDDLNQSLNQKSKIPKTKCLVGRLHCEKNGNPPLCTYGGYEEGVESKKRFGYAGVDPKPFHYSF